MRCVDEHGWPNHASPCIKRGQRIMTAIPLLPVVLPPSTCRWGYLVRILLDTTNVLRTRQAGRKFILLRARTGALLCVDQHAADERIKLEELERQVCLLSPQYLALIEFITTFRNECASFGRHASVAFTGEVVCGSEFLPPTCASATRRIH